MLSKDFIKRLHNMEWDSMMDEEGNRSQRWTRDIKPKVSDAIDELALLAHKLPDDKQDEIFGPQRIAKLISALLFPQEKDIDTHDELDSRRTKIAALLANKGLVKCKTQYIELIQRRPELGEDLVSGLEKTRRICDAISLEIESKIARTEELRKNSYNLTYLFNWNRLVENLDNRFRQYLRNNYNVGWIENAEVRALDETTIIIVPRQNEGHSSITLILSKRRNRVKMNVYDMEGIEKPVKHLVAKKRGGELAVFDRKKPIEYNTIPAFNAENRYTDL